MKADTGLRPPAAEGTPQPFVRARIWLLGRKRTFHMGQARPDLQSSRRHGPRSLSVGGVPQAGLRTALNLEWIDIPSNRLDELLPRCQRAHEEAVLQASQGGRSTHPQAHAPGVVAFMNTTLGEHIIGR